MTDCDESSNSDSTLEECISKARRSNGAKFPSTVTPQSLRRDHQEFGSNRSSKCANVTDECKDYVARKLGELIDRSIKYKKKKTVSDSPVIDGGVRLFSTSANNLLLESDCEVPSTSYHRQRRASTSSSDSEMEERLRSVAVSPDWVLSKKGVFCEDAVSLMDRTFDSEAVAKLNVNNDSNVVLGNECCLKKVKRRKRNKKGSRKIKKEMDNSKELKKGKTHKISKDPVYEDLPPRKKNKSHRTEKD